MRKQLVPTQKLQMAARRYLIAPERIVETAFDVAQRFPHHNVSQKADKAVRMLTVTIKDRLRATKILQTFLDAQGPFFEGESSVFDRALDDMKECANSIVSLGTDFLTCLQGSRPEDAHALMPLLENLVRKKLEIFTVLVECPDTEIASLAARKLRFYRSFTRR